MNNHTVVNENVDWKSFLARHDLYWSQRPLSFDEGAFLGNGMIGAMIFGEEHRAKRHVLRYCMGRIDVTAKRPADFSPRIPLGEFDLEFESYIYYGTSMRLDLWNAELNGDIVTTKGKATIRSFIHSLDDIMFIEIKADEAEHKASLKWYPHTEVDKVLKNADGFNLNQYIPDINVKKMMISGINVCLQIYSDTDGCTTAWCEKEVSRGHKLYYACLLNKTDTKTINMAIEKIKSAMNTPIREYEKAHQDWWHGYYKQSFVSLPDTRLEGFYWIQMYKMACTARQNSKIIDNQGPWMAPTPWAGTWFNMNVQMAYSPVYTSNHLEIGESLCRNLDANMDTLINNVRPEYRHDSAGLGRFSGHELISPVEDEIGNLVWLLHSYFRQYRYSMDDVMLRDGLYPLLRRGVNYYLHRLEEDEDGKLHMPHSISPEYGSFLSLTVEDCNYDLFLLRWGIQTLQYICKTLRIKDDLEERWNNVIENLTPCPIDETGYMIGKDVRMEHGHRHFSHLLGVFPLHIVDTDNEHNWNLVYRTLRHWFSMEGDLRGFSFAGAASIAATLGLGDEALAYMNTAIHLFKPNTMYKEAGPVVESPLAIAESIHDMLLQSYDEYIRVFPAVPSEWKDLAFSNLRAEGAFLISAYRKDGKTKFIRIKSLAGEPCKIKSDLGEGSKLLIDGEQVILSISNTIATITLKKGEEAILYSKDCTMDFNIAPVAATKQLCNYFGQFKPWRLYGIPFDK